MQKCKWVVVGFGMYGYGELGVVWLVGAKDFEAFFVDDDVGVFLCDFCFFSEDFMVVYFGESGGETFFVFWKEDMVMNFVVVYQEGTEPFGY